MTTTVWTPKHPETSRMWKFMRFVEKKHQEHFSHYQQLHDIINMNTHFGIK